MLMLTRSAVTFCERFNVLLWLRPPILRGPMAHAALRSQHGLDGATHQFGHDSHQRARVLRLPSAACIFAEADSKSSLPSYVTSRPQGRARRSRGGCPNTWLVDTTLFLASFAPGKALNNDVLIGSYQGRCRFSRGRRNGCECD
jgi:hypothetical protein